MPNSRTCTRVRPSPPPLRTLLDSRKKVRPSGPVHAKLFLARGQTARYVLVVGKPDLFAKRTMADHAGPLTNGGATWKDAPEIGLEKVQGDGILAVHDPARLQLLPPPWNTVSIPEEIFVEFKMLGDHVDLEAISRVELRRQARETQRIVESARGQTPWTGRQSLWLVSGYVPDWALERYRPLLVAPGCYEWSHEHHTALWIPANELPLREELLPFLVTRTGRQRNEFVSWVLCQKKLLRWVETMIESGLMVRRYSEEDIRATAEQVKLADAEGRKNLEEGLLVLLDIVPNVRKKLTQKAARDSLKKGIEKGIEKGVEQGMEKGLRNAIVSVLCVRNFEVGPQHLAKIEACSDRDTLQRWHARAVCAASVDDALS